MEAQFNPSDLTTKTVVEIQAEQQKEYKLIGSINVPRGMKLFAFNTESYELKEVHRTPIDTANFTDVVQHKKDIAQKKTRATFDAKAIYIIAINKKNANKKLARMMGLVPPKPLH